MALTWDPSRPQNTRDDTSLRKSESSAPLAEDLLAMLRSSLTYGSLPEHPVIGFAACRGAEADPVASALGSYLAREGKRVVIADLRTLQRITQGDESELQGLSHSPDGYWRLPARVSPTASNRKSPEPPRISADPRIACLELLRSSFDYTFLEASSRDVAVNPVLLGALADAVVLIVEAGKCPASQVERTKAALEAANANLLGCVLTGRQYPVPDWIYKRIT